MSLFVCGWVIALSIGERYGIYEWMHPQLRTAERDELTNVAHEAGEVKAHFVLVWLGWNWTHGLDGIHPFGISLRYVVSDFTTVCAGRRIDSLYTLISSWSRHFWTSASQVWTVNTSD